MGGIKVSAAVVFLLGFRTASGKDAFSPAQMSATTSSAVPQAPTTAARPLVHCPYSRDQRMCANVSTTECCRVNGTYACNSVNGILCTWCTCVSTPSPPPLPPLPRTFAPGVCCHNHFLHHAAVPAVNSIRLQAMPKMAATAAVPWRSFAAIKLHATRVSSHGMLRTGRAAMKRSVLVVRTVRITRGAWWTTSSSTTALLGRCLYCRACCSSRGCFSFCRYWARQTVPREYRSSGNLLLISAPHSRDQYPRTQSAQDRTVVPAGACAY